MWPKLLDIPKDQCVGLLRNLGKLKIIQLSKTEHYITFNSF